MAWLNLLDVSVVPSNVSYQFGIRSSIGSLEFHLKKIKFLDVLKKTFSNEKKNYLVEHIEDYRKRQNLKDDLMKIFQIFHPPTRLNHHRNLPKHFD